MGFKPRSGLAQRLASAAKRRNMKAQGEALGFQAPPESTGALKGHDNLLPAGQVSADHCRRSRTAVPVKFSRRILGSMLLQPRS